MARTPTVNNQGNIEFEERVSSPDGDNLVISLELDAIDSGSGFIQKDTDSSNISWLDYNITSTINLDGSRDVTATIEVDPNGVSVGNDYRLEVLADDSKLIRDRKTTLSIIKATVDGTGIYPVDNNETVWRIASQNSWEYSNTSITNNVQPANIQDDLWGAAFDGKGENLLLGDADGILYHYSLTTPSDLSTLNLEGSDNRSGDGIERFEDLDLAGDNLYCAGSAGTEPYLFQYSWNSWDLSSLSFETSVSPGNDDFSGFKVSNDGTRAIAVRNGVALSYELTTPYDLNSLSFIGSTDLVPNNNYSFDSNGQIFVRPGGDEIFGFDWNEVVYYTLANSWDTSSITKQNTWTLPANNSGSTIRGVTVGG